MAHRRRRKNPFNTSSAGGIILLVVAAFAVYELFLKKTASGSGLVSRVICGPISSIANAYVAATSCPAAVPTGSVILPNGQAIPVSSIACGIQSVCGSNAATFQYNCQQYELNCGHDANGNWHATALGCCGWRSCCG